ncbi:MAG TPA: response regulator transcription factor [Ktedonobacteraceae bacterium]|jgi:two-component system response regulator MprA
MIPQRENDADDRKLTVLLVDDEPQIIDFLRMGFSYEGFDVRVATTGPQALQCITEQPPDLIILDLMLPGLDGMSIAQRVREAHDTAIIMLTAKDEVEDRVAGLDIGADDYVTKPFAFKELMARARAVLRRHEKYTGDVLTFQGIKLNRATRLVICNGHLIDLTPREFDLLELFLMHPHKVLKRDAILARIWGYNHVGDDNVIEVYVRHLREKLDDNPPRLLQTVRGVGYVLRH